MLCLGRKRDQKLIIAGNIVITILEIRGDKVRLGIEAPAEVPAHRMEVWERIQEGEGGGNP